MSFDEIRGFLMPGGAEEDEGFRAEIERQGRRALRIIGWVEILMPVAGTALYLAWMPDGRQSVHQFWGALAQVVTGILTLGAARTAWGSERARAIAVASGLVTVCTLIGADYMAAASGWRPHLTGGISVLVVLLVGVAVIPARPVHMFVMGVLANIAYAVILALVAASGQVALANQGRTEVLALPLITGLCTMLVGVNYRRLHSTYQSHQLALRASEEARKAEARTLIAESAASMARLAAAVSHELNTPLGAMNSAAGSLGLAARRLVDAEPDQRQLLAGLTGGLTETITDSAARMRDIVARMQRFANLDRAELQVVDIRQLLEDVSAIVSAQADGTVRIRTECGELPKLPCRPQQLSAVFSSLIQQAVERAGSGGEVHLRARRAAPHLEISISDNGPALSQEETGRMFEPGFHASGGRVTTGDWSLFTARRLLHETGGSVRAGRGGGPGNTFIVSLPQPA